MQWKLLIGLYIFWLNASVVLSLCGKKLPKSRSVNNRFTRKQIRAFCKTNSDWLAGVIQGRKALPQSFTPPEGVPDIAIAGMPGISSPKPGDFLSSKQRGWLASLNKCKSVDCFCKDGKKCENRRNKRQIGGGSKAIRKEYRMLTDEERSAFHNALNALKTSFIDGISKYNLLIVRHNPKNAPGAHFGPAFLPFHRHLIHQLEVALRLEDPSVALPYWDSTLEASLPTSAENIMWTTEFMGTPVGEVRDGPFADWELLPTDAAREFSPNLKLIREVGVSDLGSIYTKADIREIMRRSRFDQLTYCDDPLFEMLHGAVHMYVGGVTIPLDLSPNDPVFFMLHAFVDKIWEDFRKQKQSPEQRERPWNGPGEDSACLDYHQADAQMLPFNIRNKEGLANRYTDEFYEYEDVPNSCSNDGACGSKNLFCHTGSGQCMAKIMPGGNCQGLTNQNPCHETECIGGICRKEGPGPIPTTPRPVTVPPTPPSSIQTETCLNLHRCCSIWSENGECSRNSEYMRVACPSGCQECDRENPSTRCRDLHAKCPLWSRNGECKKNAVWMEENCPTSCSVCSRTSGDLSLLCGGRTKDTGLCEDFYDTCPRWANGGECTKNQWWMSQNCPLSCKQC